MKALNIRQKKALGAVASGLTLKEAAKVGGYKNLESVCRLARSEAGKAYLAEIAERVDAETVFSIRERIEMLKGLAKIEQFRNPTVALAAVKEVNRIVG